MTLMPMYTAQWQMRLAMRDQRQAAAEYEQLARLLQSTCAAKRVKRESRMGKAALRRLLTSLGQAAA